MSPLSFKTVNKLLLELIDGDWLKPLQHRESCVHTRCRSTKRCRTLRDGESRWPSRSLPPQRRWIMDFPSSISVRATMALLSLCEKTASSATGVLKSNHWQPKTSLYVFFVHCRIIHRVVFWQKLSIFSVIVCSLSKRYVDINDFSSLFSTLFIMTDTWAQWNWWNQMKTPLNVTHPLCAPHIPGLVNVSTCQIFVTFWALIKRRVLCHTLFKVIIFHLQTEGPSNRKSKWASDFTLMTEHDKLIIGTG